MVCIGFGGHNHHNPAQTFADALVKTNVGANVYQRKHIRMRVPCLVGHPWHRPGPGIDSSIGVLGSAAPGGTPAISRFISSGVLAQFLISYKYHYPGNSS